MSFSFLHCSDLHLGCAPNRNEKRYQDFFIAFEKVVKIATQKQVNAIIIAGDIFHHRTIDAQTLAKTTALLRVAQTAKIPVVAIEGNHDKAFYNAKNSWLEFLCEEKLLYLLKPTFDKQNGEIELEPYNQNKGAILTLENCRFVGLGYLGTTAKQRLASAFEKIPKSKKPTVLLLHSGVGRLEALDMGSVPKESIQNFEEKIDYIALGHVHAKYEVGKIAYNPGAIESVHINEAKKGEKGCYLVEIFENKVEPNVEFIPISARPVVFFEFNAKEFTSVIEFEKHIKNQILNGERPLDEIVLQITLIGEASFNPSDLDVAALEQWVSETTNAIHIEIVNKLAYKQWENFDNGTLSKQEIENNILCKMAIEKGFKDPTTVAEAFVKIKQALLEKEQPSQIFDYLLDLDSCFEKESNDAY